MTELIKRDTAADIVARRNTLIDDIISHLEGLDALEKRAASCGVSIDYVVIRWSAVSYDGGTYRRNKVAKMVDRQMWDYVLRQTGILALLDAKRLDAFERQLESDPPEITLDLIMGTIQNLRANQGQIILDSVLDVHKSLLGIYASHKGELFPRKWILNGLWDGYLNSVVMQRLHDIDKVTALALGQRIPGSYDEGTIASVAQKVRYAKAKGGKPIELEATYWKIRIYKNGNVHLISKDEAVIDALNKILIESGHYLP